MAVTFNLSITVDNDVEAQKALDAFCRKYGYDLASGLTQRQFLKREVIEFIRAPWLREKRDANQAIANATTEAEAEAVTFS